MGFDLKVKTSRNSLLPIEVSMQGVGEVAVKLYIEMNVRIKYCGRHHF